MRFTLAIPIAMAAVAIALPQGPGGSQAIIGWCATGVPGCAYGSLWDCSGRGGNTYTYCTSKCRCENKRQPPPSRTTPSRSRSSRRPTLPPSEQLPLVKSEDKTSDSSTTPPEDEYTLGESETIPEAQEYAYETTGFTNEEDATQDTNNYFDDSNSYTEPTESTEETPESTNYDDTYSEESEIPEDESTYYGEEKFRV